MVFREWQRHRMQSYNEFSARYSQMPNEHYLPELARIQKQSTTNKQGSAEAMDPAYAANVRAGLEAEQGIVYMNYQRLVRDGVAKEIARVNTPISRYSKMRAKTDVRNWLAFLLLRMDLSAQKEIQLYARAMASILKQLFPKTFELFLEHDFLGLRLSRTEADFMAKLMKGVQDMIPQLLYNIGADQTNLTDKQIKALLTKLTVTRESIYKDMIDKL
jgi:thymidylate synthase (FAD)